MFAVAALSPLYDVYARGRHRAAPLAGVLVGLAWLGHLEMGWFAVYSAGVMLAFHRDGLRAKVASTALIGAIAALLTAPWWAGVLARHGLDPFLAALQAGAWSPLTLGRLLFFDFSDAPLLDLFGVLALLGVFVVARERRLLLPVWVLAIFLLDPRKAPTLAMLPTAMLVAEAVFTMVLPALRGSAPGAPRALAGWSLPAVFRRRAGRLRRARGARGGHDSPLGRMVADHPAAGGGPRGDGLGGDAHRSRQQLHRDQRRALVG